MPAGVASPAPSRTRQELRRDAAFAGAPRDGLVLEIGPAHNAVLPKREGFRTRTVDYLDRARLVEKYQSFSQYSPDDIEDVDYVLAPGARMSEVITERFDLVMASHVLEHTTSLVHFVEECTSLLAPNGVLCLVVPDSRYCFDRFRERSSLARVIDAALNPPAVHTRGTLTEFGMKAVRHRGTTSWAPLHRGTYEFVHDMSAVHELADEAASGQYVDVHNWVFTPNHLRLLLADLADLGYVQVRESWFHPTVGHEFFLNLRPGADVTTSKRELLGLATEELRTLDAAVFSGEDGAEG
ncbi:bifunctional 2-polyprenyl-6-hydroxyphenol methylase/3-demethylubiquinol 3-O-methyltransferase UbiG [uncultured Pseudokineococcus sp.]|uniref:class I SAM-dependent methyltransferase n=1 Tax=uncultured Pseudokineococcus sp. TaxID=1642928 RepID=UPI00261F8761|nr:methyltransferase domain-containing protein [uncultured Pseudokineococcus sp.]